jgi:hypothetical protein
VRGRACVAGASSPAASPAARCIVDWRRCPTEEKTQRPIVGTLLPSLSQGRGMNRAERRPSAGFHHGHHYLCVARHVEHDPIQIRTATRDPNELTWGDRLHQETVPRRALHRRSTGGCHQELETTPAFSVEQRRRRWWISTFPGVSQRCSSFRFRTRGSWSTLTTGLATEGRSTGHSHRRDSRGSVAALAPVGPDRCVTTRLVAGSVLDYASGTVDRFTGFVIMAVVFLEPWLLALCIAVGSGRQRRSHFWVRVLLAALALPALIAAFVGVARQRVLPLPDDDAGKELLTLLFVVGVIALMFVPGLLYRRSDRSPGPSESDGGGAGPGRPRPSPDGPRGGVPLPDAEQARARDRDHETPKLDDRKRRRPTHEPRRTPAATNA